MHHVDSYFENLGWKKIAALLVVCGVCLLGFLVFSFSFSGSGQQNAYIQNQNVSSPHAENNTAREGVIPTQASPAFTQFNATDFSISYPVGWTVTESIPSPGEVVFLFQSPLSDPAYPAMELQAYHEAISQDLLKQGAQSLKYSEHSLRINGVAAYLYQGTTSLNGKPSREDIVIFIENQVAYSIHFTYLSVNQNPDLEQEFVTILNTFQSHQ